MIFKGLEVKDSEDTKYTVIECEDLHNIQLENDEWTSLWCCVSGCEDYDGELFPVNTKKLRKEKLKQIYGTL